MLKLIDPKKYFLAIVAGVLIIGIGISSLVWFFLTSNSIEKAEEKLEIEETIILDPISVGTPSGPPSVPFPDRAP